MGLTDLELIGSTLYVAGVKSWDIGAGFLETDAYVAAFNLAGNIKWAKSFGTKKPDGAFSVTADEKGNAYVTGFTEGALQGKNSGSQDVVVRKYSSAGKVAWTQQFGSSEDDFGFAAAAFSPDRIYVGGSTRGDIGVGNRGSGDAFLTRLDSGGNRVWMR